MRGSLLAATAALAVVPFAHADQAVGLTSGNGLIRFDTDNPAGASAAVGITGLQAGESILGIDYRPATGELFGLGSTSRLYMLNATTGAATGVGGVFATALSGTSFGFDFNPTVDRIRVVSNAGQNMRLNPITGAVAAVDLALKYDAADPQAGKTPNVVAAAYTNNFAGATSTTLYDIDSTLDLLARQDPPNDGVLKSVGFLGFPAGDVIGFDIAARNGVAFAVFSVAGGTANLYRIDLASGQATAIGGFAGTNVADIAVTIPAPASLALLGLGGLLAMRRRR